MVEARPCSKCKEPARFFLQRTATAGNVQVFIRPRRFSNCVYYVSSEKLTCREMAATFDEAAKLWNARHA